MRVIAVALMALWVSGCAKSKSTAIATSEIYGTFAVTGNSTDTVICSATLRVGGLLGTHIELDGNDALVCSDGTTEVALSKTTDILGIVEYTANAATYEVGRTYTVSFRRSASESHSSTAVLPTAVAVSSPTVGQSHTKETVLAVAWTAATSASMVLDLSWTASGVSGSASHSTTDDGSDSLATTETATKTSEGQNIAGNVSATLTLTRSTTGTAATTLKGASIEGRQKKTIAVTLVD